MKNGLLFFAACFILSSFIFVDGIFAQGGFTGPSAGQVVTVKQAKKLRDDSMVILQGNISRSLGNEKYSFVDGTGEIILEIDLEIWSGQSISENDKVEIYGEIEFEKGKKQVDVKTIKKI
ncbi:MAG: NirD/YgiW/YdeI family stress tolerance protein [Chitinivibrionia bacterium]|nr:NirD/YgiW/YdeI family stress tolerance protein [Chitinivibrionia bacterium]